VLLPKFVNTYNQNTGLNEIITDDDNLVRRFTSELVQVPDITLQIMQYLNLASHYISGEKKFINYQGPKGSFNTLSLTQLFDPNFEKNLLEDKIIIIGSKDSKLHNFQTPVGQLTRSEITANIMDNFLSEKWIQRIPIFLALFIHFCILILSIYIISLYPQSAAFIFFLWIAISYSAISIWAFDSFYIWTPILSIVVQLFVTYLIFLSYKLTVKDYQNLQLEQERRSLMELEQLKQNFVSLFSHDLKTPIAKIQAICDRLILQNPKSEISHDLKSLRKESSELHRYIQSILHITRVESRDFKLNKDATDINETITQVVDQVLPLAKAKKHQITTDLEPLFLIDADPVLIHEVILNLVENAIKYTPESGKIDITTRELNDMVFVRVKDSGPGIKEKDQGKVFEKFYRAKAQQHNEKGSGLGLYLVKYFIELHGGKVFLKSQPNRGTEIGFSLPI
jgi:signal transduction histidine kinase